MTSPHTPIIVIAGPTASGKSSLALKLAKETNGQIINGDSRQIYKELTIGTAKPTPKEMQNIPHHLYGHISLKENYNIYKYQKDVKKSLGKNNILVGGSGLYLDSVVFNYKLKKSEGAKNPGRRGELNKMSVKDLQLQVKKIDPKLLEKLNKSDRENPVRLIRIIEKGLSNERGQAFKHIYFVIDIAKEKLDEQIVKRTELMFEKGLIEENIKLRKMGLDKYPAFKTIGYQEFDKYFINEVSLDDVKKEIIKNTKRYAKRQKTWFRRHKEAIWTDDYNLILEESLKLIKT